MAWIKRNGDGALFEVFGTRRADHGYTEVLVYLPVPTGYYAEGWIWVPLNDFKPLKAVNIAEAREDNRA